MMHNGFNKKLDHLFVKGNEVELV